MNKQGVFRCPQSIGLALALIVTVLMASGCSSVGQTAIGECDAAAQIRAADAIPILVTLTAKGGETLAAARERVLARLREAMPAGTLRAVHVYETLPAIALPATPGVLALLLTLPDVRSIEADRSLDVLATATCSSFSDHQVPKASRTIKSSRYAELSMAIARFPPAQP